LFGVCMSVSEWEWEWESNWKWSSHYGTEMMIFVVEEESEYGFRKKQGIPRVKCSSAPARIMIAFVVVLLCSTAVIIRASCAALTGKK
jgi:hypothetical protein